MRELGQARTRAQMLDEGLVGLWSGEPFGFEGEHDSVAGATWILEFVGPEWDVADLRAAIAAGPPRG